MNPTARAQVAFLASPLAKFRPWITAEGVSPQRDFLAGAATHHVRVYRGGNRSGKSTVGHVDSLLRALGWHPFSRIARPQIGWILVPSWEQVSLVNWPSMRSLIPISQVKSFSWMRKSAPEIPQAIIFKGGGEIHFRSGDAGREKMQGAKIDFAMIDEELDGSLVEEVRARLLDTGGDLFCTLTPLARKAWVRELEREPDTLVVRANMRDAAKAGIINSAAVERYLSTLSERQRQVREKGDLVALEGLVYPEFSRDVHVLRPRGDRLINGNGQAVAPWPLPATWPRYGAVDFGYANPFACVVAARSPWHDALIVYVTLYRAGVRISRWGEILRAVLPPLVTPLAADHDAGERAELDAAGVPSYPATKDVVNGLEEVERRLHVGPSGRPGIYFVVYEDSGEAPSHPEAGRYDAERLVWELEQYRYPDRRDGKPLKDQPVKVDDHAADGCRYLCMLVRMSDASGDWWAPSSGTSEPGPITPDDPRFESQRPPRSPLGESLLGGGLGGF